VYCRSKIRLSKDLVCMSSQCLNSAQTRPERVQSHEDGPNNLFFFLKEKGHTLIICMPAQLSERVCHLAQLQERVCHRYNFVLTPTGNRQSQASYVATEYISYSYLCWRTSDVHRCSLPVSHICGIGRLRFPSD